MAIFTGTRYFCGDEERRNELRRRRAERAADPQAGTGLDGIDYLEVVDQESPLAGFRQKILLLRCFGEAPADLSPRQVAIAGGERIRGIRAIRVARFDQVASEPCFGPDIRARLAGVAERVIAVFASAAGDFSTYRLSLVNDTGFDPTPLAGFDPRLAALDFSFKVECPSPLDCAPDESCAPAAFGQPELDYLAKDFPSFRRLMLDRMAATVPDWRERHPADLGVALVEVLAYVADQLSYFQDAVATEAYLGTARRRVSVGRHARLIDYRMDQGAAASVLIALEVDSAADGFVLPGPRGSGDAAARRPGTTLVSRLAGERAAVLPPAALARARREEALIFETRDDLRLSAGRNRLRFHTWSDQDCCLPAGATSATLKGDLKDLLAPGDLLIFEEVLGPRTGQSADADPAQRHPVRLRTVTPGEDLLLGEKVTEIGWHAADAPPFPICISATLEGGAKLDDVSVARGNVVLADHGDTRAAEQLAPVPPEDELGEPLYRPLLEDGPISHPAPLSPADGSLPIAARMNAAPDGGELPALWLFDGARVWDPRRELLGEGAFAATFVAEVEDDGRARLRFGDNRNGLAPASGTSFEATYRVGQGPAGNAGESSLAHLVLGLDPGILRVRNLLPAWGGRRPESLEEVRRYAPQAFRVQQRAVTAEDYARAAERHPEVAKAAATLRWTGSWLTAFVAVDRRGGLPVDEAFESEIEDFLGGFRLAAQDVEVHSPLFVPLELALHVCVGPDRPRATVVGELLRRLGSGVANGRCAFFHPDHWTFGQPVYLSAIVAAAMEVEGVESVAVETMRRWGRRPQDEVDRGVLTVAGREIARLDNDRSRPENGLLRISAGGGR